MIWKILVAFVVVHALGMATYLTVVDQYKCRTHDWDYNNEHDCYGWKGAAGVWEIVILQEFVIRPLLPKPKD